MKINNSFHPQNVCSSVCFLNKKGAIRKNKQYCTRNMNNNHVLFYLLSLKHRSSKCKEDSETENRLLSVKRIYVH